MLLICQICHEGCVKPIVTQCGHGFCQAHLAQWLRSEATCPVCRHPVDERSRPVAIFESNLKDPTSQLQDASFFRAYGIPASPERGGAGRAEEGEEEARERVSVRAALRLLSEQWDDGLQERVRLRLEVARLRAEGDELRREVEGLRRQLEERRPADPNPTSPAPRPAEPPTEAPRRPSTPLAAPEPPRGPPEPPPPVRSASPPPRPAPAWVQDEMDDSSGDEAAFETVPQFEATSWEPRPASARTPPPRPASSPNEAPSDFSTRRTPRQSPVPFPTGPVGPAPTWTHSQTFSVHAQPVHAVAVHPERPLVASASWDSTCKVYDLSTSRIYGTLAQHARGLYGVQFCRTDLTMLGTSSSDRTCRLWNFETGQCLRVLSGHSDEVNALSFHWERPEVATVSDDRSCLVFDLWTGVKQRLEGHKAAVYGVAHQPQGEFLVTCSFDRTLAVWDPRAGALVRRLEGHTDDVIGVDVDASGTRVASGSDDGSVRLWDARMWECLALLREHRGEVKRVRFSPSGRFLGSASGDGTARVWEPADLSCVSVLEGHSDHVFDVAWGASAAGAPAAAGRPGFPFAVTASHDHKWRLWRPA